ncbi:tyrosine-type recombinase/integrase [Parabacteroides distasonis]|uniref:tyrosine-type recombinase/integrase n=1 Tax=Parabacteroides distasonis TaxID=823 RepID=UPI00195272F7|nr:tyrosine-type recombinase/integrase [Parabacteroides distasonis]MBM6517684.1 tyrosine-type recombinase/integrase [Parabacteroides distasonis]UVR12383.1 tyrosine-type recombinase/integrase [Parabacteroides distasonis]
MEESNFYDLRKQVVQQLRERHYAPLTICAFKSSYNKLECYMLENKIEIYSARVGEDFLKTRHKGMAYAQLSDFEKNMVRHIKIMNEVLHTGIIIGKPTPRSPMFEFKGDLGIQFNEFICHERRIKSPLTVSKHHLYLRDLYDFLKENNKLVKEFGIPDCLLFLRELKRKKRPWHHVVSSVRAFVRYSCERNLLADCNFSRWDRILCLHRPKNPQLPSYYSREEIKKMLDAIDRSCPKGKRDYAMLLLAARYGLRASDIVGITYANFEWEFNRLSLVQAKTGKPVSFPLSEEIGSAIIDYIKFGRPDIDSPHVFLEHMAPYQRISPRH